ncbi:MarR family winged helix-turn-helix transcriptional regulator [Rhizorhapis sp. SPR117]|uniref:MarR family winged helix-turn-helix transcriptional regulator n=1 Tax=Rhizorhapis sp. SPR117 TaxID=2912611 RepID=UPI001F4126D1
MSRPRKSRNISAAALFELTNALQPIRRSWSQAAGAVLVDFDLPGSVASAVVLVSRAGDRGIQQNVLAEVVGVNPGGMVRILDQAEAAGLLERRASTDDRRINFVHILPEGRRLARKMELAVAKLRKTLLGDLPVEDIETTTRVLRLFEDRIGAFLQQERVSR